MFRVKTVSLKTLLLKIIIFVVPWSLALLGVSTYYPDLVEWPKLITNIFSSSIVFLMAYVLTVLGFRYSSKDSKKEEKPGENNRG